MRPLVPTLSLQVTYQCNIECGHCGPFCGPHEKEWMSVEEIIDLIRQADQLGALNVVFTGGEPSLLGKDLPPILRFIKEQTSIASTRIVTNAKWATTPERARETLRTWQEAGLDELNVSCGEFHQEFVPVESVANAYHAGRALGYRTVLLAAELLAEGKGKWTPKHFHDALGEVPLSPDTQSPFVDRCHGMQCGSAMCSGRGEHVISRADVRHVPYEQVRSRCQDVFSAITAHPNGNLTACCGVMVREESFLTIGNWRTTSLKSILEAADQDLILNWIKYLGLKDMKRWLLEKEPSLGLREQYVNHCDLCQDMIYNEKAQEILLASGQERSKEIVAARIAAEGSIHQFAEFAYGVEEQDGVRADG